MIEFQAQMFEPESERDRLLQQRAGVLIFATAVQTAQHQKKVDDIGFGAGPACLDRSPDSHRETAGGLYLKVWMVVFRSYPGGILRTYILAMRPGAINQAYENQTATLPGTRAAGAAPV